MVTQLNLPIDISWRRLAFSIDMVDRDFAMALIQEEHFFEAS